jgi:hypothetical protein
MNDPWLPVPARGQTASALCFAQALDSASAFDVPRVRRLVFTHRELGQVVRCGRGLPRTRKNRRYAQCDRHYVLLAEAFRIDEPWSLAKSVTVT